MKVTTVTPMLVRLADGTTETACCGPRALRTPGLVGYQPQYADARPGVCCHTGAIRRGGMAALEVEARDTDEVYEALGAMLGSRS